MTQAQIYCNDYRHCNKSNHEEMLGQLGAHRVSNVTYVMPDGSRVSLMNGRACVGKSK